MQRPYTFDELAGNKNSVNFLRESIRKGEFPEMILLTGPEGIGKTSLAKLLALEFVNASVEDRDAVIKENKNTKNIKSYRMSLDSSIENIQKMLEDIKSDFIGASVYILDECHCMPNHVMDALLTDSEYIPSNKKIILCTTDKSKLSKQLLSRTFIMYLKPPTKEEVKSLVKNELTRCNIVLENEALFLELLLQKYPKPRAALKLVQAIGCNRRVRIQEYDIFIEYEDSSKYKDLLLALESNPIAALVKAEEVDSIDQLVMFVKSVLTFKLVNSSIYNATELLECQSVSKETLIRFLEALLESTLKSADTTQNKLMHAILYATRRSETAHKISKESETLFQIKNNTLEVQKKTFNESLALSDLISNAIRVEE